MRLVSQTELMKPRCHFLFLSWQLTPGALCSRRPVQSSAGYVCTVIRIETVFQTSLTLKQCQSTSNKSPGPSQVRNKIISCFRQAGDWTQLYNIWVHSFSVFPRCYLSCQVLQADKAFRTFMMIFQKFRTQRKIATWNELWYKTFVTFFPFGLCPKPSMILLVS